MQTYTNHKATDLTEADLPNARRTADSWPRAGSSRRRPWTGTSSWTRTGLAHIVADDLENMYQGCTEDVANFDPWD